MKTLAVWSLVCVFALLWLLSVLTVPADSFAQGMRSPLSPIKPPTATPTLAPLSTHTPQPPTDLPDAPQGPTAVVLVSFTARYAR